MRHQPSLKTKGTHTSGASSLAPPVPANAITFQALLPAADITLIPKFGQQRANQPELLPQPQSQSQVAFENDYSLRKRLRDKIKYIKRMMIDPEMQPSETEVKSLSSVDKDLLSVLVLTVFKSTSRRFFI
jgi:hypothetical protein